MDRRQFYFPWATMINMGTVTLGSALGLYLGNSFSEGLQSILFQALGLGTLLLGIKMALELPNGYLIVFLFSLILGGLTGELLGIQSGLTQWSETLKNSLSIGNPRFTEGLITAFLLFCVGSVTILGALEEGLEGKRELLLIKSMLDGFSSIALSATFGIGVLFSILPMLIIQGGITLLAGFLKPYLDSIRLALLSSVGGVLIIGIGFQLLEIKSLNLENLLPALLWVFPLAYLVERTGLIDRILRRASS